jgi:hypothetical protein
MRNLESAPDVQYIRLLVAKLTTSPSTPEVLKVADRLADETRFAYVTRDSRMTMGDIYGRLGRRDKAAAWYRKADVPESRIPELLSARTMFADGKISGRLLFNGKPMVGAKVGIAPFRTIRDAFASTLLPGVVRPFWLRWIGPTAVTDANGRFEITHITAGEYRLLFTHPDLNLPPMDTRLIANTNAGRIFVGFGRPATQLGDIEMMLGEGASGPQVNPRSRGLRASPELPPPSDRSPAI